jgi:hypothetical protein
MLRAKLLDTLRELVGVIAGTPLLDDEVITVRTEA